MPIKMTLTDGKVPVKIFTDEVENSALEQLRQISNLDCIHHHIAAMPDVHMGIGATVGSVIPTVHAIIPSAVGVDIGCGMIAVRLSLTSNKLPDNLKQVRHEIEKNIPVGFNQHKEPVVKNSLLKTLSLSLEQILIKHPEIGKQMKHPYNTWTQQLATLGGGNHFIEICLDESQNVWIMLHSGSRNVGNVIGKYFINLAKKEAEKQNIVLPNKDLAYLKEGTIYFDDYVEAVNWAQNYAYQNRQEMLKLILNCLKKVLPSFEVTKEAINCHHNYVALEEHFGKKVYLTRKGAISAKVDELGIIPGSMGAKSFIVKGKGNPESFNTSSHGAGRRLSRTEAKSRFTLQDVISQTCTVECRKDKGIIDELPQAYKDIDTVMENQNDLVDIVHTLKQVVCVKG